MNVVILSDQSQSQPLHFTLLLVPLHRHCITTITSLVFNQCPAHLNLRYNDYYCTRLLFCITWAVISITVILAYTLDLVLNLVSLIHHPQPESFLPNLSVAAICLGSRHQKQNKMDLFCLQFRYFILEEAGINVFQRINMEKEVAKLHQLYAFEASWWPVRCDIHCSQRDHYSIDINVQKLLFSSLF